MAKVFEGTKAVGTILNRDTKEFFPDLPKLDADALLNVPFRIDAARLIDWDYENNQSGQFGLCKVTLEDNTEFITILGGKVLTKQVKKLIESHKLPLVATLVEVAGAANNYRTLADPPAAN